MYTFLLFTYVLFNLSQTIMATTSDRAVLAHFIFGNVYSYTANDWRREFDLASAAGIDAFAFNIAQDAWTNTQLDLAFKVAAEKSTTSKSSFRTKICFSFDFAVAPFNTQSVITVLKRYVGLPAHFKYQGSKGQGRDLVSTFDGPARTNVDWVAVKAAVPNLYVVPHLGIDTVKTNPPGIDGALNWNAWATRNNLPINGNASTVDDHIMQGLLGANKAYATLVSPWSFTNFHNYGVDKSWIFKSDELLLQRWQQMLGFASSQPGAHIDIVELYSWNDYGESNYMNDIVNAHNNEFAGGDDAYCKGFKHDGWRYMNMPFIYSFKNHLSKADVQSTGSEFVTFHHRPYLAATECVGQNGAIPGAGFVPDQVTVYSAIKSPVQIEVVSGGKHTKFSANAGVQAHAAPMQVGQQSIIVTRNGKQCGTVKSSIPVTNTCKQPNYNANVEYLVLKC